MPWTSNDGRLTSLRLRVAEDFALTSGDVLIRRADGFIAYHLATVVDDLALGINEVVRGKDLAQAMYSQLAVIDALGLNEKISQEFSIDELIPCAGQGIIAIQCRDSDNEMKNLLIFCKKTFL